MLECPEIQDQHIISRLQGEYGLHVKQLTFLPLGADVNTAVFRVITQDEAAYFLKFRRGDFDEICVLVPQFLKAQGIDAIIAPLQTSRHEQWTTGRFQADPLPLHRGKMAGGHTVGPTVAGFWCCSRAVHAAQVPPALARIIPQETFSPGWRELVREFQAQVETVNFDDPTAAKLAAFMKGKRGEITHLVARAEELARGLRSRSPQFVLCHYDIHAGNLLLGADDALYIVDWDNPTFAPKERDLILMGGSAIWNGAREEPCSTRDTVRSRSIP
jgi:spectinomycin phosphotransferase